MVEAGWRAWTVFGVIRGGFSPIDLRILFAGEFVPKSVAALGEIT